MCINKELEKNEKRYNIERNKKCYLQDQENMNHVECLHKGILN